MTQKPPQSKKVVKTSFSIFTSYLRLSINIDYLGYILLISTLIIGLFIGQSLNLTESWQAFINGPDSSQGQQVIMWWVRIPQLFTALLAGAVLSTTGAAMQQLLRNDLADPYLLGIAAGGGLGAALALSLDYVEEWGIWFLPLSSFIGAFLSSIWIEVLAFRQTRLNVVSLLPNPLYLLLSGVALNLFLSSLLTLTLALSDEQLSGVWRWLIGHISVLSWSSLCLLLCGSGIGIGIILVKAQSLTLLGAGEEVAWSLGVNIKRTRTYTLLAISLSVGTVVSFCGIIGFIGLLVPHFIRPRIPGNSQKLFVLSMIYGAWVLLVCHLLTLVITPSIPVGVLTGVIGGLVFLLTLKPTSVN